MLNDNLSLLSPSSSSSFLPWLPQVKPLLMVARQEETFKAKEEELRAAVEKVKELEGKIKDQEEKMATLSQEKNDLALALAAVSSHLQTMNNETIKSLLKAFLSIHLLSHLSSFWVLSSQPCHVGSPVFKNCTYWKYFSWKTFPLPFHKGTFHTHIFTLDPLVSPQEQDTLGDAEERCTQLMHQKVQLEESVQVIWHTQTIICVFMLFFIINITVEPQGIYDA